VGQLTISLEDFYGEPAGPAGYRLPPGLDGALQAIFEDFSTPEDLASNAPQRPADELIGRLERDLVANVYRWTGHFPEPTRCLVQQLAQRARQLKLAYPVDREAAVAVALTNARHLPGNESRLSRKYLREAVHPPRILSLYRPGHSASGESFTGVPGR